MKIQLRLDKATIQTFLLENVEKMAFGLVAIIFVLMVYSVFGVERYPKTPEQLSQAVKTGEEEIARTPQDAGLAVKDYVDLVKQGRTTVVEEPYVTATPWDRPLFPKRPGRDTPTLFAAQDLRGNAAFGAFQMTAAGATEIRGQRWVVLTALVPIKKQNAAYKELGSFGPSSPNSPQKDIPQYSGYFVQRLEVVSPADAKNPDWKKAEKIGSSRAVNEAMTQWAQQGSGDVVASKYISTPTQGTGQNQASPLVFPLGPRVDSWAGDESVAHPEEIPLEKEDARAGGGSGSHMPPTADFRATTPPAVAGAPVEDEFGNVVKPGTDATAHPVASGASPSADAMAPPVYFLFRFFDFKVEPGKHYIYRVQLGLKNPNYQRPVSQLKDPTLAEKQNLFTKWSEPSPMISVPRGTRILAGSVKPGREPVAKIDVAKWSRRRGVVTFQEFSILRGQAIEFPNEKVTPPEGVASSSAATSSSHERPLSSASTGGPFLVNYFTGAVALDFRGGELFRGRKSGSLKLAAGGDILMVDSDGNLVVRDELEDESVRQRFRNAEPEQPSAAKDGLGVSPLEKEELKGGLGSKKKPR